MTMIEPLPETALILETERLRLTPLSPDDLDIAQRVLCDPRVMHYVSDEMTPEAVVSHMKDAVKRGAGGRIGIWCITRKDTGEKIGDGVLTPVPIDEDDTDWTQVVPDAYPQSQIEVGYLFVPEAWGRGFATETCARLLRFAFEMTDLPEVVATTDPENVNSQHVLKKCGMRSIGRKRAYGYDDVEWLEVTREEWNAQASNQ
ncbi:GNAT family N-acetyltransferase [Roseovarius sp. MMSF_3305]|uniref:GNAT family N-acetyltransferase n=2 Tax=unclassified Roseovarius TaxID=2614913 RepID=UPI00273EDA5C|nr:GNAT family N-acetyltransferase [Roseovarius sp. MMSF_3305]